MPTIEFDVRDEVYDWIEDRAEDEMMNKSSIVEHLLVRQYKDEIKAYSNSHTATESYTIPDQGSKSNPSSKVIKKKEIADEETSEEDESTSKVKKEPQEEETTAESQEDEINAQTLLEEYSDHWYVADAESGKYALRIPEDAGVKSDILYYDTKHTLQDALDRFYVDRPERGYY